MLRTGIICALFLVGAPRPAAAEWHFTPMVGLTFNGSTNVVDLENATGKVHPDLGGAVDWLHGIFGAEGLIVYTPGFFTDTGTLIKSSRTVAFMGNAVLTVPRKISEYTLRPYVSGGIGAMTLSISDRAQIFPIHSTVPALNVGGGVIGFLTNSTGVRFDFRYYSNLKPTDTSLPGFAENVSLSYMSFTVGVVIRR
jgi:hypothetical protein